MQFPPEIISTKFSKLLRYNIIQTLVILGNVVDVAIVADGFEVATGTFYLTFLRTPELRTLKVIAFGFSHEIDVLDTAFPEGYCPVGIVLAHWRVDVEAVGQLGIDHHVIFMLQRFCKVLFCSHAVEHHEVIERLGGLDGVYAQLAAQHVFGEDVGRELVVQFLVLDTLDKGKRLAVIDNQTCLDDEFSLNRWKVVGLMPFRISTIDLRLNPVAVTSLPIRS